MKKRIVSLCLVLAMMLCLFPVGVSAAETAKQTWSHLTVSDDGMTATGYCPHCCDDPSQTVPWDLLTRPAADHTNITADGHYFLNASTATNGALQLSTAGINVVIHLNGHTFKRNGTGGNNTGAIRPQAENTTISIVDDQAEQGVVHGDYGWAVTNNAKAGTTVKLYSGNLTSVVDTIATTGSNKIGGTVYLANGTFKMYGGTVNGTKATYGGAIRLNSGDFEMYGGTINGGRVTGSGGAIYMNSGTFKMSGGTITGAKTTTYGGAICLNDGTFEMSGGTINGAAADRGGALYMSAGSFQMTGGTITGSKATYGGAIFVSGNTAITISNGTINGGEATKRGGAIYTGNENNVVNISGGTIQNGVCVGDLAEGGGNIYAKGTLNITGGTIAGGKSTNGGNIYALGTTVVNGDVVLKNGEATNGGNLYVNAATTLGEGAIEGGKATYGSDIYVVVKANMTVDASYNGVARVYYDLNHLPDDVYSGESLTSTKRLGNGTIVNINRNTGVFTGKLYLENDPGAPYIYAKAGDDKLYISTTPSAALVGKDGNYTWYDDNNTALAAYNENTAYLKADDTNVQLNGGEYVIDLAGRNLQINGTGTVTLFDSANDDYASYGVATLLGSDIKLKNLENGTIMTTVAGRDTFMIKEDTNQYSFHTMGVDLIGVTVRPSATGMYYTGMWKCDEKLAAYVDTFGVAVSLVNQPGKDYETDKDTRFTEFNKSEFKNGVRKTGVIIRDILDEGSNQNGIRSKQKVYATAYVTFTDGSVTINNNKVKYSLYNALEIAEARLYDLYYTYEAETFKGLTDFYNTWAATGVRWDLDMELSEDEKAILDAYENRFAYHGEAHDHAATDGGSDGNYTLDQLKQGLQTEEMDFTTIVDHHQDKHMRMEDWDNDLFIGGTEASSSLLDDAYTALESNKVHYSMIFTDYTQLDTVLKSKFGGSHVSSWRPTTDKVNWVSFDYKDLTKAELQDIIAAVKAAGGMFTIVHPKSDGYIASDDPLMYYFADWTGLEVLYGAGGYAPAQAVNKENYDLWVDLLEDGYKIWATAGSDKHAGANTDALTTIYSDSAKATRIFDYMKTGNSVCGPVGIRMMVGNTQMGSQSKEGFADQKLIFTVSDFHESVYNPDHTYRVKLIKMVKGAETEEEVFSEVFNASIPYSFADNADANAAYYRVEIWDTTAKYSVPIAIGNPIWNS